MACPHQQQIVAENKLLPELCCRFGRHTVAENGNKVSPFSGNYVAVLGQQSCRNVAVFGNFVASVDRPLWFQENTKNKIQ